jgi:hypothetical protein
MTENRDTPRPRRTSEPTFTPAGHGTPFADRQSGRPRWAFIRRTKQINQLGRRWTSTLIRATIAWLEIGRLKPLRTFENTKTVMSYFPQVAGAITFLFSPLELDRLLSG